MTQIEKREIESLREIIRSTNNGYLFSPTGKQIEMAEKYPDHFKVVRGTGPFPVRILLNW